MRLETTILKNLVHNEPYARKVLPFLVKEYFTDLTDRSVFDLISQFIQKYNKTPTVEILELSLQNTNVKEQAYSDASNLIKELQDYQDIDTNWLVSETEKFCRDKAVYNAILKSIGVLRYR